MSAQTLGYTLIRFWLEESDYWFLAAARETKLYCGIADHLVRDTIKETSGHGKRK